MWPSRAGSRFSGAGQAVCSFQCSPTELLHPQDCSVLPPFTPRSFGATKPPGLGSTLPHTSMHGLSRLCLSHRGWGDCPCLQWTHRHAHAHTLSYAPHGTLQQCCWTALDHKSLQPHLLPAPQPQGHPKVFPLHYSQLGTLLPAHCGSSPAECGTWQLCLTGGDHGPEQAKMGNTAPG